MQMSCGRRRPGRVVPRRLSLMAALWSGAARRVRSQRNFAIISNIARLHFRRDGGGMSEGGQRDATFNAHAGFADAASLDVVGNAGAAPPERVLPMVLFHQL